jgi:hypothetical protein
MKFTPELILPDQDLSRIIIEKSTETFLNGDEEIDTIKEHRHLLLRIINSYNDEWPDKHTEKKWKERAVRDITVAHIWLKQAKNQTE